MESESSSPFSPVEMDLYAVFGMNRYFHTASLYNCYRSLSKQCHPDNQSEYDPSRMPIKTLSQAEYWYALNMGFEVLSNPTLRALYTLLGPEGLRNGFQSEEFSIAPYHFSGDCHQIYKKAFGHDSPYLATAQTQTAFGPPPDWAQASTTFKPPTLLLLTVQVTLEDLFYGTTKTLCYIRPVTGLNGITTHAQASVEVKIHPGTLHGEWRVFHGAGPIVHDVCGQLVVLVCQLPHPVFNAHGTHLSKVEPLPVKVALHGGVSQVRCIDGKTVQVEHTEKVWSGMVLILHGEGMPFPNGKGRGDLFVEYLVYYPKNMAKYVKEVLSCTLDSNNH